MFICLWEKENEGTNAFYFLVPQKEKPIILHTFGEEAVGPALLARPGDGRGNTALCLQRMAQAGQTVVGFGSPGWQSAYRQIEQNCG